MSETLIIRNATVIDGTGHPPRPAVDVAVRDGVIVSMGVDATTHIDGATVDATDKFLIPGLWETETHLSRAVDGRDDLRTVATAEAIDVTLVEAHLRAYTPCGFTTVVDLGGPEELLSDLRDRQRRGEIPGPRVLLTGRQFTAIGGAPCGPDGERWPTVTVDVGDVETARRHLYRMIEEYRIDAVKANYTAGGTGHFMEATTLKWEILQMLAEEGRANGLCVHAHIDTASEAIQAIEAGVANVEHIFEPEPDRDAAKDVERVTELCLEHGVYWPFTLVIWEGLSRLGDASYLEELSLGDAVPASSLDSALHDPRSLWVKAPPALKDHYRRRFEFGREFLAQVTASGVKTTCGSDPGPPPIFHGPPARRELELMVSAGMSPMDVLVSATRHSAEKYGRDDSLGTIEVGKIADVVLLDADPLADIRNIHRVVEVYQAGQPQLNLSGRRSRNR